MYLLIYFFQAQGAYPALPIKDIAQQIGGIIVLRRFFGDPVIAPGNAVFLNVELQRVIA